MLISKDIKDKKQSVFKCDRCKAQLTNETKVAIYTAPPRCAPKKKYDYCFKCYRAMVRGTERGIEKKEG